MITRIQLIRNIGMFDSVSAGASIPLGRLTVVYSENGRGKTTLAAILRSLSTGDPLPIVERQRLAAQNPPHVVVECQGGPPPAMFQDGSWNRTLPEVIVFDDVFVDQNVHSGLAIHTQHRHNLHEFILGTQAVALGRELDQLIARIEDHNRELRALERAIPSRDRGPFTVDEFCLLQQRADIELAIQEAERALAGAKDQEAIRTTPSFARVSVPDFDLPAIEGVLQEDLPALESATLAQVHEHLRSLGDGGEAWVADGMRRIATPVANGGAERCPFCGQGLQDSNQIGHYRAYFSDAYSSLKGAVARAREGVELSHTGEVFAGFERAVRVAIERRQFWSRFCEVPELNLDTAAIVGAWRSSRDAILAHLRAKEAAPLERLELSKATKELLASYRSHRKAIDEINRGLEVSNRAVDVAKERAATADSTTLTADLARLKAVRARHEVDTALRCDEYVAERAAKETTESQRDQVRASLEQHRSSVFPGYQTAINLYLARFNAGFRLDSVSYANTRGGPTCTYNVLINNVPVPVGGAEPAPGQRSFRNTLSAGDRNTLALAFFFASLDQDPLLPQRVAVIDDPISSLDEHRALTTAQEMRRLAERSSQVIVLSHDRPFLCRVWSGADSTGRAALEVVRDGNGSTLRQWDVTLDSITEHDRRFARLRAFLADGTGDLREVARSVRPHLEAFLRVACPEQFPPSTLLGPFRYLCQQRLGTADEVLNHAATQELEAIVEYANRFHHDTNPAWETEAISDGELRGFVERTLRFARA